jgi:glycosyltransferase involved in cell wall biosynthesis
MRWGRRNRAEDSDVKIGFVIRTLNESKMIGRCLDVIHGQRGDFDKDILIVDSGSTDATLEIVRSKGARIYSLPPGEFDYSKALNVGIDAVQGDIVVSLSAHAIPTHEDWLERMTAPFADPRVAGVASRQIPWPDAPWQEVHRLAHQFPDASLSVSLPGASEIIFSNAASAIRRTAWIDRRFTLPAAEDLDWAQRVVADGWTIHYEAAATVHHSHNENARAQALRLIDLHRVRDADGFTRPHRRRVNEVARFLVRDSRKIFGLTEPWHRKLKYLFELLRVAWFYVVDFSRLGTTAERRSRVADTPRAKSEPKRS